MILPIPSRLTRLKSHFGCTMKVSLFVPCLVDRFLPAAGAASVRLLESVGVTVRYDQRQTCCGQPPFNAGHPDLAVSYAGKLLARYDSATTVIIPSGSCADMIRESYGMLDLSERDFKRWQKLRSKVFELSEFLVKNGLHRKLKARLDATVAVHQTCHHLRHIKGEAALTKLLNSLEGAQILAAPESQACCGFGGIFSIKLPELSVAIGRQRLDDLVKLKPDVIALADAGCALHLDGIARVRRERGESVPPVVHYAQLFTGDGLGDLGGGR